VRLVGQPAGVRAGGKLSQPMRKVRVKALPSKMPQHLELNVADLGVNQSIKISDLKFDGLTMLDLASNVVVAVKMTKKEQAAEGAAAPAKGAAPAKAAAKK
jgi:large subunit ribosomal protein L25